MKRFAQLFAALDSSNRKHDKLAASVAYFQATAAEDAAWGLHFLLGKRLGRLVSGRVLRSLIGRLTGLPDWLIEASYAQVGDLAETMALLIPGRESAAADVALPPLHQLVAELRTGLADADEVAALAVLKPLWQAADETERLLLNKLLTGGLRVGVSRATVIKALAEVAGVESAVMAHRLMGGFAPSAAAYRALFQESSASDTLVRPYPFYLAYPLDLAQAPAETLGAVDNWQVEWKWDGIRAQLLCRDSTPTLWSRGEELIGDAFPEIIEAAVKLPVGTVLDGEVVAWDYARGRPLVFGELQRRIGRKRVTKALRESVPVRFIGYDLLESEGQDRRLENTAQRRRRLEQKLPELTESGALGLSPLVLAGDWQALQQLRTESRQRGVEGFMLKRKKGPYRSARVKGDWWKWKIEPFTLDAVLVNAVQGHGRRAGLFSDYTFALRCGDGWVPFAKAYSGLSDAEMRRVDAWIRKHTLERHGPVRIVEAQLVFEIAFEAIAESRRHKCGLAVRFPRIQRWREDKTAEQADALDALQALATLPC